MKYLFLLDANHQSTTDTDSNTEFEAEKVYELDESIGEIFVKRGAAVVFDDDDDEYEDEDEDDNGD